VEDQERDDEKEEGRDRRKRKKYFVGDFGGSCKLLG